MKAFVSGGAGFIGSNMVDRLLQNINNVVTVFDNFSSGRMSYIKQHLENSRFQLVKGDLLDSELLKDAIKGHNFVFHFAANSDIMKSLNQTDLDFKQGILATFHVLESMRIHNIQKIAYMSGSGIYGDFGDLPLHEDLGPLLPKSMYGASKLSSEGMISAYSHLYGIRTWIFRAANVIGSRPTHGVIFDFINKLKKNSNMLEILGDGTQTKPYIHISDFLDALFFIIKNTDKDINLYNVGADSSIDVRSIAEIVVREMNLENVQFKSGKENRGWRGDVPRYKFDLTKLHNLGWKAKLDSKEAVIKSVKEILKNEKKD